MLSSVIERLNDRRNGEEGVESDAGFTLIELMVVLLIMAILLAIAIPTFLGVKGGAQDRAAQSDLNTALTNAKAIYGNNQSYVSSTITGLLGSSEASLSFSPGANSAFTQSASAPGNIYVFSAADGNGIAFGNRSQGGACWWVLTNETAEVAGSAGSNFGLTSGSSWPELSAGTWYASTAASTTNVCTLPTSWTQNSFPVAA